MLNGLRDGLDRAQIVQRLQNDFEVDGAAVHLDSDVGEFLRMLVQQALVPADFDIEPKASAAMHVQPTDGQGGSQAGGSR